MGDLISREALKKAIRKPNDKRYLSEHIVRLVFERIDNAPTVEERPQGEWISVSERLPEKEGHCIVSTDYGDVTMDSFVDGMFVLNLGSVTAWQPLPKPYKETEK